MLKVVEIGVYWFDTTKDWQLELLYQDVKEKYGIDIKINKIYEAYIDSDKITDGIRYYEKYSLIGDIHCDWEFVNNNKNIAKNDVDSYISELLIESQFNSFGFATDYIKDYVNHYIKDYVNHYVDNVIEKAIVIGLADENDVVNVKYY